jgi:hypothetical protein
MGLHELAPVAQRRRAISHNNNDMLHNSCPLLNFDNELFSKKSVGWAAELVAQEISADVPFLCDPTDTWYQKPDYQGFRQECRDSAHMAKVGNGLPRRLKQTLCVRGIEMLTDQERRQKRVARRQISRTFVLNGGFLALEEDNGDQRIYSNEFSAEMHQEMNALAQHEASSQGFRDEQEAIRIRREDAEGEATLIKLPSFRRTMLEKVASAKNVFVPSAA